MEVMATAKYRGEEVEVTFTANMVRNDYGVERSPVWHEPEDIEIDTVSILGVEVDPKYLPEKLVAAIHELSDEVEFKNDD